MMTQAWKQPSGDCASGARGQSAAALKRSESEFSRTAVRCQNLSHNSPPKSRYSVASGAHSCHSERPRSESPVSEHPSLTSQMGNHDASPDTLASSNRLTTRSCHTRREFSSTPPDPHRSHCSETERPVSQCEGTLLLDVILMLVSMTLLHSLDTFSHVRPNRGSS